MTTSETVKEATVIESLMLFRTGVVWQGSAGGFVSRLKASECRMVSAEEANFF